MAAMLEGVALGLSTCIETGEWDSLARVQRFKGLGALHCAATTGCCRLRDSVMGSR
jgi:hypothetical protein